MSNERRKYITPERKNRVSLTVMFSVAVFLILLAAITLASVVVYLLVHFEVMGASDALDFGDITMLMIAISATLGITFAFLVIKFPLKPINRLINKMNSLASGDYDTRLEYTGMMAAMPSFNELSGSFNKLATELGNTEMFRSDFINNFSHEFKTPIVSIVGFARLLKSEQISEEEKKQYIEAIEEESIRLSSMATNILTLSKVESQTILSDVSRFNLSEQIRSCILLLEAEWSAKNIELQVDFDEIDILANEELLKHIWINLIDNAVKFTERCGTVCIDITKKDGYVTVSVINTGREIPAEKIEKIWTKFYQADESHSTKGNGIGLAIVKRIAELHGGDVEVKSENGSTAFTVTLPEEQ